MPASGGAGPMWHTLHGVNQRCGRWNFLCRKARAAASIASAAPAHTAILPDHLHFERADRGCGSTIGHAFVILAALDTGQPEHNAGGAVIHRIDMSPTALLCQWLDAVARLACDTSREAGI
jgi:hypothetical protein